MTQRQTSTAKLVVLRRYAHLLSRTFSSRKYSLIRCTVDRDSRMTLRLLDYQNRQIWHPVQYALIQTRRFVKLKHFFFFSIQKAYDPFASRRRFKFKIQCWRVYQLPDGVQPKLVIWQHFNNLSIPLSIFLKIFARATSNGIATSFASDRSERCVPEEFLQTFVANHPESTVCRGWNWYRQL